MYKLFSRIEFYSALMQGKGWGSHTVKKEISRLKNLHFKPKLVIDIGANVGEYTFEFMNKYPNVEMHLFEPSHKNYEILLNKFADPNVLINNLAVSSKAGIGKLFTDVEGSGLASLTKRRLDHFSIELNLSENVEIITFESYWKSSLSERPIDLVKIDVEGHELDVLNGFGDAISKTGIIQFEFGGCNLDTKTTFQDFWYYFKQFNFKVYRITPFGLQPIYGYSEIDEYYSTTNFICVSK